ncbi:putative gustatory receptor 28b isoform X1 [Nilaparvata lugens]|uniref:putative gustatory receptor 28b isoform X1 n=1 Tax=Nilaparvata lugens TaxID=108931 RepID=UPI00193DF875|nr:putative gustatory receptor 28b isoform X1 [Nilaparvata lugens]
MNRCYGGQILTIMFSVFVKTTSLLYGMESDLTGETKSYRSGYVEWIYFSDNLIRLIQDIFKVYFLVSASASVSNEAGKTALIVSRLLSRKLNSQSKKQLEVFSVQLLHTEVNITACGIFTLNYSVLTGMIGAITTYLIILIQFKNSDKVNKVVGEQ